MKWIAEVNSPRKLRGIIKEEEFHNLTDNTYVDWYYLFVYENDNPEPVWDDLQDTLEAAKEIALEELSIPLNAWVQVR